MYFQHAISDYILIMSWYSNLFNKVSNLIFQLSISHMLVYYDN